MKKSVSLLLTVLMAMSIITVAATSVSAAETAKVNNQNCYVGQKVVYTYFLQAPGKAEDFQGHLEYTDGLKLEKVELSDVTGVMADGQKGVMVNTAISNNVYYSGVNINEGYDYTTKSAFITAEFSIEKSGDQTVANKLEILSGSNGTQYVEDYKAIEGVQSSEETTVQAVDAESVKLDVTAKTVYTGSKFTLKATVTPELAAATNDVEWSSSNETIATVDNGVVTAKKPGYAYITVTTKDSNKTARCKITVKAQKATKVTVNVKKSVSLQKKGKSVNIKATVTPSNTYNKTITVSNSNKKAVKISATKITSGKTVKVTALKKGSSNIKFTAADGSRKSTTVKVTVKK